MFLKLFFISTILFFLSKFITAIISFKLSKEKKIKFSEVFIFKNELFDSAVVSLILISFTEFVRYYQGSKTLMFLLAILILSILLLYHFLIMPLRAFFQKKKFLKDNELEEILRESGFSYSIRIIKGNVINAFATGFIPYTKTILVGEPLLKKMSKEELKSIIYHEIGHLKLNHIRKMYFLGLISSVFSICINMFRGKMIMEYNLIGTVYEVLLVSIGGLLYGGVLILFSYVFQRKMEYQADSFAVQKVGAELYVQTLNKLNEICDYKMNKGSMTHPPIKKRIENAWKTEQKNNFTN